LGLRTVWVTQYLSAATNLQHAALTPAPRNLTKRPVYVDVKVKSIRQLPEQLHRLR
jgi:putative hydrolase of the HAD superfamily